MGMGEENGAYGLRRDGERLPVPAAELPFLVQPAFYQHTGFICFKKIPRASDVSRRAQKSNFDLQDNTSTAYFLP